MSDGRDKRPKSQVPSLTSQDDASEASHTRIDQPQPQETQNRNAGEIAGETTGVVGASTGGFPRVPATEPSRRDSGKSAVMVGAGILLSRIIGVVRQRVFGYYLGLSDSAGAFNAAFRIPNFLQNIFGEGALSASFIPVYAKLLATNDDEEASRVADAVFTLLALATSVIVVVGVLITPQIISVIAPGFTGSTREKTA